MAMCKECLHHDACKKMLIASVPTIPMAEVEKAANRECDCKTFKQAADVVDVRHGEWVEGAEHFTNGFYEAECSECGNYIRWNEGNSGDWNYCPNCGARMDGADNG